MNCENRKRIPEILAQLEGLSPQDCLKTMAELFPGKIKFGSSLGLEDQVITHMIATEKINIGIFTLDTGRMFQETYSLIDRTRERYKIPIEVIFPDSRDVEQMVNEHGANLFYESVKKRLLCCRIRKTEPSQRVLKWLDAWVTGIRRSQAVTRTNLSLLEWDDEHCLIKVNPLINWELDQVWEYVRANNIPYNPLHDKGFPSVGCLPCTRAVKAGEDVRSGRWWWENPDKKECGLHGGENV
jgi:phosphoadenosine phosphosulfate reductase